MARRLAFDNDPNMEYPLAYRLAQFLLQSSQQLGGYEQGLAEQSKGASNVLESLERQDIARDELGRRTQEDLYTREYRTADLADKAADRQAKADERRVAAQERADKAALEGRKRKAGGTFLQNLGQLRTTQEPLAPIPEAATAISPQAEDRTLANFLWGQRPSTPLEAFRGMDAESQQDLPEHIQTSVLKEAGETPDTKVQFRDPTHDIVRGGQVLERGTTKPKEPKEPPAPSRERDFHAMALKNLGPGRDPAEYAAEVRRLAFAEDKELAGIRAEASLGTQQTLLTQRDQMERSRKADEAASELAQVDAIMQRMEAVVPKVNTPGLQGRVAGLTTRKLSEYLQTNPDINELAALGQGYVSVIAKIVQRQSGVLSDQDLRRAEASVPQTGDELGVATRKLEILRGILDTARGNIVTLRGGTAPATTAPPPGFKPR